MRYQASFFFLVESPIFFFLCVASSGTIAAQRAVSTETSSHPPHAVPSTGRATQGGRQGRRQGGGEKKNSGLLKYPRSCSTTGSHDIDGTVCTFSTQQPRCVLIRVGQTCRQGGRLENFSSTVTDRFTKLVYECVVSQSGCMSASCSYFLLFHPLRVILDQNIDRL